MSIPPGLGFNSGLGLHGLNLNAGAGLGQQYTNYDRPQSYGYYYNPAQPAYAPAQSNYYAAPTVASYNPAQPSSYTTYRLVAPPSYTLRYTESEPTVQHELTGTHCPNSNPNIREIT